MALSPPVPFAPPKTPPVFRIQKTAWRSYLLSGGAMQITIVKPPDQVAGAATVVSGQVYVDPSLSLFPPSMTVQLIQRGATKGTQAASVDTTGAFTVTFPANTLAAGNPATAQVSCTLPVATALTPGFNVT